MRNLHMAAADYHRQLGPEAQSKVRQAAMGIDRRAHDRSEVYRQTPPAELTLHVTQLDETKLVEL